MKSCLLSLGVLLIFPAVLFAQEEEENEGPPEQYIEALELECNLWLAEEARDETANDVEWWKAAKLEWLEQIVSGEVDGEELLYAQEQHEVCAAKILIKESQLETLKDEAKDAWLEFKACVLEYEMTEWFPDYDFDWVA